MSKLIALFLPVISIVAATTAVAQDIPTKHLAMYSSYRAGLLVAGWKPIVQQGVLGRNGKPMYGYKEVVCGNRTCSAEWSARDGRKVTIGLWRDASNKLVLAPDLQFN